jgi:hypothetical protein
MKARSTLLKTGCFGVVMVFVWGGRLGFEPGRSVGNGKLLGEGSGIDGNAQRHNSFACSTAIRSTLNDFSATVHRLLCRKRASEIRGCRFAKGPVLAVFSRLLRAAKCKIERAVMKPLQLPQFRAVALWAGVIGIAVLTAPVAKAFTFNDAASDKTGDTSMFNDPAKRAKSDFGADKSTDQRPKSGFYFSGGQSQSFDDRNGSERYFNPNRLLGR